MARCGAGPSCRGLPGALARRRDLGTAKAGREMAVADGFERGDRLAAGLDREAAARPEGAAAIELGEIGRRAPDRIEPRPARLVEPRYRFQQRHRVGMAWLVI